MSCLLFLLGIGMTLGGVVLIFGAVASGDIGVGGSIGGGLLLSVVVLGWVGIIKGCT